MVEQSIQHLQETRDFLLRKLPYIPKSLVVLGSGLADLFEDLTKEIEIPFREIPHFPALTVKGHRGTLALYRTKRTSFACLRGRFHFYDIGNMQQTIFPYRALAFAGIENFILTNASGSLRSKHKPGAIVLIKDHINLFPVNPLSGKNIDELGPRFLDVSQIYDKEIRRKIKKIATKQKLLLNEGIYIGCSGPTYETPAEAKMFANFGGDVVGMSTVPEALALHHMKKKICGISFVSNFTSGVTLNKVSHEEVLTHVKKASKKSKKLLEALLEELK